MHKAMNKKLTIIELAELVATKAQTTNRMGELFLKELFATVAQELIEGRNVEIKSLGSFTLKEGGAVDEAHIDFIPAQAVAEAINQPFAQFTPLELNDDITPEQLQQLIEIEPSDEDVPALEEIPALTPEPLETPPAHEETSVPEAPALDEVHAPSIPAPAVVSAPVPALEPTSEPISEAEPVEPALSEPPEFTEPIEPTEETPAVDHEAEKRKVAKSSLLKGIVVGALGTLLLTTLLWILFGPKGVITGGTTEKEPMVVDTVNEQKSTSSSVFKTDKPQPVEPKKEIPVIRDTVTAKRPLTVIARKHYGNEFFYVYIYEENKDRIKDVNNIAPGTEVIIPLASKYGFDPKDPESIKQAQLKSMELNKRR
jgi:nucleoid-associated protein YgaU